MAIRWSCRSLSLPLDIVWFGRAQASDAVTWSCVSPCSSCGNYRRNSFSFRLPAAARYGCRPHDYDSLEKLLYQPLYTAQRSQSIHPSWCKLHPFRSWILEWRGYQVCKSWLIPEQNIIARSSQRIRCCYMRETSSFTLQSLGHDRPTWHLAGKGMNIHYIYTRYGWMHSCRHDIKFLWWQMKIHGAYILML